MKRLPASAIAGLTFWLGFSALGFSVQGCSVGPDYHVPSAEERSALEASLSEDARKAGISSGEVIREWWTTLKDASLEALVQRVLEGNLDLKTAESRVREARAERGLAAASFFPIVALGASVGDQGTGERFHSSIAYNGGLNPTNLGFDSRWEIDVWGAQRRGLESADASLGAAIESRRDTLVTLLGELGLNYVELRGEQRQLEIAIRNLGLQEKTVELVTVRRKTGFASDLQVSQAKTQFQTTRAQIPSIETAIARSIHRLSVLCGLEPEALEKELGVAGPIPEIPPLVPVGLPSQLLLRRPDIRKAERDMAAANAQIGVAKADYFPRFALTGDLVYGSINGVGRSGTPSFYIGPQVVWPIFDGFRIASNIATQDARLERSVLAYRRAILVALEEVTNAVTAYAKELVRRDALRQAAQEAEHAVDTAQTQYKNGLVDFLNVVDAQGTLAATQQAMVLSEQTLLTDLIALYKSLGGGWEVFETDLTRRDLEPASTELPR